MAHVLRVESTPNPNSRKFVVDQTVASDTKWFGAAAEAGGDALAAALFAIDGVTNVMMLNDFVTVGKTPGASWDALVPAVEAAITAHL